MIPEGSRDLTAGLGGFKVLWACCKVRWLVEAQ